MPISNGKGKKFKSLKSILFHAQMNSSVQHPTPSTYKSFSIVHNFTLNYFFFPHCSGQVLFSVFLLLIQVNQFKSTLLCLYWFVSIPFEVC